MMGGSRTYFDATQFTTLLVIHINDLASRLVEYSQRGRIGHQLKRSHLVSLLALYCKEVCHVSKRSSTILYCAPSILCRVRF
jgi:hypothetical protein